MSRTMGAIYSGLVSRGHCVLATNDILGQDQSECAIVKVNSRCGAFAVTAGQPQLHRFMDLRKKNNLFSETENECGLSPYVAETIAGSFEAGFRSDPAFISNPLPFLLLLIGYGAGESGLEHIFMRNRVVTASPTQNKREYVTGFEIKPPVAARSLFYGHAELARFWARPLMESELALEDLMLLAYYSLAETQKLDRSLAPGIHMATLSASEGFRWVAESEIGRLSSLAEDFDGSLREGLSRCIGAGSEPLDALSVTT
jgi:hypothetical protein